MSRQQSMIKVHSEKNLTVSIVYGVQRDVYGIVINLRNYEIDGACVSGTHYHEEGRATSQPVYLTFDSTPFLPESYEYVNKRQSVGVIFALKKYTEVIAQQKKMTDTVNIMMRDYLTQYVTPERKAEVKALYFSRKAATLQRKADRALALAEAARNA